jgi:hypothetical protein
MLRRDVVSAVSNVLSDVKRRDRVSLLSHFIRNTLAVSVVLAAGIGVCDRAQGSCGDYLHTRYSQPISHQKAKPAALAKTDDQSLDSARRPHRPCEGPGCRQQSPPDSPTAPVPTVLRVQHDGAVMADAAPLMSVQRLAADATGQQQAQRGFPQQPHVPPEV